MSLTESQSKEYFMYGCIPARLVLSAIPLMIPEKYLKTIGVIIALIGVAFLVLYTFNLRENAPEGGGKTWWSKYRIIHGLLYLCAGLLIMKGYRSGSILLFIDTLVGSYLFYEHRYN